MADKYKLKDRPNLTFDIAVTDVDHDERLVKARERRFLDNDRDTFESIMTIYDDNKEKLMKGSDDEQVMLLSTLNAQREFMGWFIGEALIVIDEQIKEGRKGGYNSINEWLNMNEDRLGFGKSMAYDYIRVRKSSSLETFKKLGVKKTIIVAQVKDEKKREKIYQTAIEKKMTEPELKEYVQDIRVKDQKRMAVQKQEVKQKAEDTVRISITKSGSRGILVETNNGETRDALLDIMNDSAHSFKMKVMDVLHK